MKVRVIPAGELSQDLRVAWTGIQHSRADLASPYFTPGFVAAAASCRARVRIGVLEDGGRIVGFLPFELQPFGVGHPVGGRLSDFHGVIARSDLDWRAEELVEGCGLRMWRFDHLLRDGTKFDRFLEAGHGSPALDLRGGFERYHARRRAAGSRCIDSVLAKSRKLRRQQGEVQFEFDARDPAVFEQVMSWKSAQCRRTGVVDFLAVRENAALLRTIYETRTAGFAGILSVLRVGGRIAAAHFGMRSHDTLHYWFPAYERDLGRYSPGAILLVEMIRAAPASGLVRIDLGKGDDSYKRRYCTHEVPVAEGAVIVSPTLATLRKWHRSGVNFLRTSMITAPLRALRGRLVARAVPTVNT